MLQLVQSPSQRIQRLIEEHCSKKQTKNGDARQVGGKFKPKGTVSTSTKVQMEDESESNEIVKTIHGGDKDNSNAKDADQETSDSRVQEVSSVVSSDSSSPSASSIERVIRDRDGNVLAASSSYSSSSPSQRYHDGDDLEENAANDGGLQDDQADVEEGSDEQ